MESVISKISNLSLGGDKRKTLGSYYVKLKQNKTFWKVEERNEFLVMDENNKLSIFLKSIICKDGKCAVICTQCMDFTSLSSTQKCSLDAEKIKSDSCLHSLVCYLLWTTQELSSKCIIEHEEKNIVRALPVKQNYMALVLPAKHHEVKSGVVFSNGKTLVPKCKSCSGRDCCFHLR